MNPQLVAKYVPYGRPCKSTSCQCQLDDSSQFSHGLKIDWPRRYRAALRSQRPIGSYVADQGQLWS